MSDFKLAYRYAKSLIDLAVEQNKLDAVADDMGLFIDTCSASRELSSLLRKPIVNPSQKMAVLDRLFSGKVSDISLAFFRIVSKKGRNAHLESISNEYLRQWKIQKGIQDAELVTSIKLSDELEEAFKAEIAKSTGKQVNLNLTVDPDIIGGFLLRVGDRQIDETLKSKLNRMYRSLTERISSTQIL